MHVLIPRSFLIFRAVTDPRDGRRVALKKLPNVFQSLVSSKRVFRELKMLCFFKHDNVSSHYLSVAEFSGDADANKKQQVDPRKIVVLSYIEPSRILMIIRDKQMPFRTASFEGSKIARYFVSPRRSGGGRRVISLDLPRGSRRSIAPAFFPRRVERTLNLQPSVFLCCRSSPRWTFFSHRIWTSSKRCILFKATARG